MWAMQYLVCERPRTFITSGGLGTMGYGLPAAVGAKAARPEATVVCIDGDGCFQMTCQELATAALERLPIVVVIINNGWLGMVRQWQELFYAERYAETHLTKQVPDYAQLAEALGGAGFVVESEDELASTLQAALELRAHRRRRRARRPRPRTATRWCPPARPRSTRSSCPTRTRPARGSADARGRGERLRRRRRPAEAAMSQHTVSVELENKPGALARVSQMFARRGYNIQSLAVGPTERPEISRLTLRVDCSTQIARADREADAQARERAARGRAAARRSRSSASWR